MSLNEQQISVIKSKPGLVQCIAGAGSGKTTVVINKVIYELRNGLPPESILAVTFTNKAAGEMRDRLREHLDIRIAERVSLVTLHSWCYKLLRENYSFFGLKSPKFRLAEDYDEIILCLDEFKNTEKSKEETQKIIKEICKHFSWFVSNLSSLDDRLIDPDGGLIRTFERMREFQYAFNYWTFDDLMYLVYEKLHKDTEFRKQVSQQYRLVIVDEAQDCNKIQNRIVAYLAEIHKNLLVVGDDFQSIYFFRFAHVESFTEFSKVASVKMLETNYRSTPEIVDLGNAIIAAHNSKVQVPKVCKAFRDSSKLPELKVFHGNTDLEETRHVVDKIVKEINNGVKLDDIAILMRSIRGKLANLIQAELVARRIPFKVVGGSDITKSVHVKKIIAAFMICTDMGHIKDWMELLTILPKVGDATADKILKYAPNEILMKAAHPKGAEVLQGLFDLLSLIKKQSSKPDYCVNKFKAWYVEFLKKEDKTKANRILSAVGNFFQGNELADALVNYQLLKTDMEDDSHKGKIWFSTVHAAKGKEWDTVILPNLTDAGIPWVLAKEEKDLQEECRVLYVAVTRAKTNLYMSATLRTEGASEYEDNLKEMLDTNDKDPEEVAKIKKLLNTGSRSRYISRFLSADSVKDKYKRSDSTLPTSTYGKSYYGYESRRFA